MPGTNLNEYKGKVAEYENEVQEAYAQIQRSISPELRRRIKAIQERGQQLFAQTTDRKNYVIERLQLRIALKDAFDRTNKERGLLRAVTNSDSLEPARV